MGPLKVQKLSNYRSFVSQVLLLVVVENIEAGELISAEKATSTFSVKTSLDSVYVLNKISGKVSAIELARF